MERGKSEKKSILFIYLRSLGAKSQEKLNRVTVYIANREALTDGITWNK